MLYFPNIETHNNEMISLKMMFHTKTQFKKGVSYHLHTAVNDWKI